MPKFSTEREREKLNPDNENILPIEEEVRRLKEELIKKERMLRELRAKEKPSKIEAPPPEIFERRKEKVEKEKEKIKIIPEKAKKVPLPAVVPIKIKEEELARDLANVMALNKPKQVKMLVYLAFKKGINYAANIAMQLRDPYLLDEFHDTLVDYLYDLLVKKKKIKIK